MLVLLVFVVARALQAQALANVKAAWERQVGAASLTDDVLERQARMTWSHVRAARLALAGGFVDKARASYNTYLARFPTFSAEFVADVCLRLAVFEQCHGNQTGARDAFIIGARVVGAALARPTVDELRMSTLRERGATLYCSWGLHESKRRPPCQERVVGLLEHAVRLDASKRPVLGWSRWRRSRTRLRAHASSDVARVPFWKSAQEQRYEAMIDGVLGAARDGRLDDLRAAAAIMESRCGKPAPALSPRLLGTWTLVHAAALMCCAGACATKTKASIGTRLVLDAARDAAPVVDVSAPCRVELDGGAVTATYQAVGENVLEFTTDVAPFDGILAVTYLDDHIAILRRLQCGHPLVILQRDHP